MEVLEEMRRMTQMNFSGPYLLFLGDAPDRVSAKTAAGIRHWRPEKCGGQLRFEGGVDLGCPDMSLVAAKAAGLRTLVIGIAPFGGDLPQTWRAVCKEALDLGMDVASGLHARLAHDPELAAAAASSGARIVDVRTPPAQLVCGTGQPRPGRRLLTVGTDCAIGKMFAALEVHRAMEERGLKATFRATGQTGIMIDGAGVPVDAVVADFISGAVEVLAPANAPDHWDVIEGQGALFQPAYAGVSLGLLHGAQPDALVVCHELGRTQMDDMPGYPVPSLDDTIAINLAMARVTNPAVRLAGVSLNTSRYGEDAALTSIARLGKLYDVPVIDPVRTGAAAVVEYLAAW